MFKPSARHLRLIKTALFLMALLPLMRLVVLGFYGQLTANPIEFITRSSGDWTLYFLMLTLVISPLRCLSAWSWLVQLRRMLGLFTFFYACLHFITFIWFDHFFDLQAMWKDILKRPFITVGFTAFVLLVPLAVTSNDKMMRFLGRRWQTLHKLVYVIAVLAILHFWWMRAGKNNFAEPLLFGSIMALLLGSRIVFWLQAGRRKNSGRAA